MDTSTTELIKNYVGSLVRWLLVLVAGILVKKGIISTAQSDVYVQQLLPVAIGAVMGLIALIWGLWQKRHANQKVDKALALPAGTSREALEQKV